MRVYMSACFRSVFELACWSRPVPPVCSCRCAAAAAAAAAVAAYATVVLLLCCCCFYCLLLLMLRYATDVLLLRAVTC